MAKLKALFVIGTRPDTIKSAPVIKEFLEFPDLVETKVASTGQHREMLDQALASFDIKVDFDLEVMRHGQTLAQVTSRSLEGLDKILESEKPDIVFAQGDTTATFVSGLASFYRQLPFAHIEAGLRTDSVFNPFPEEFNRRAVSLFATLHFPPTEWSAQNLIDEGVDPRSVFVTGNTGIDAVRHIAHTRSHDWYPEHSGRVVLLTTHRRENWGRPQEEIADAALNIVDRFEDVLLVVPMHRNPSVRETLTKSLGSHTRVRLIDPPDYADFVTLMRRSDLILTDSGGVQEEAPTFGVPVLVLRETTERPEGVSAGTAMLVGTSAERILAQASKLLSDPTSYSAMAKAVSPYGDGRAAQRIRYVTLSHFGVQSPAEDMWT